MFGIWHRLFENVIKSTHHDLQRIFSELHGRIANLSLYCCRFFLLFTEIMSQDHVSEQADAVQTSQGQILNITLLASEWKTSEGGLSTFNRELAIHLAQIQM